MPENVVKYGDVSQRVGVEVIRARGVDVEKLIKMCTGKPRSALRILTDQQKEMRKHRRRKKLPAPYS